MGFNQRISGVGSYLSTHLASTTAQSEELTYLCIEGVPLELPSFERKSKHILYKNRDDASLEEEESRFKLIEILFFWGLESLQAKD